MKFVKSNGMDISVFSLGTVQLGMDYGLGDYTAKPSQEYAFELLDRALEQGVNTLDTANNYGDSEKEIGRVCVQLASPDFKYMSGETLTLEGGMGLRP